MQFDSMKLMEHKNITAEDYLHELRSHTIAHESLQAKALDPADLYSPTQQRTTHESSKV